MTLKTQQVHLASGQELRVARAVRGMASHAALDANCDVLKHEWALFVAVTFEAGQIGAHHPLLSGEAPVLVVTVDTGNCSFRNFMMKWEGEGSSNLIVALIT
jgi:hypothetical protein